MGTVCSKPEYIYIIDHLGLTHAFCVKRSSGEWESGHVLVPDTTLGSVVNFGDDEKYPRDALRGHALATSCLMTSRSNIPEGYGWNLLLSKEDPDKPIKAWRALRDIRPDGTSEEDAVAWRVRLIEDLDKLEKERYP